MSLYGCQGKGIILVLDKIFEKYSCLSCTYKFRPACIAQVVEHGFCECQILCHTVGAELRIKEAELKEINS